MHHEVQERSKENSLKQKNMAKLRRVLLILAGVISIVMSIVAFRLDLGMPADREYYGGDAFTGIQHAAARTGTNLFYLTNIVHLGTCTVLFVGGITLIAFSLPASKSEKNRKCEKPSAKEETTGEE